MILSRSISVFQVAAIRCNVSYFSHKKRFQDLNAVLNDENNAI